MLATPEVHSVGPFILGKTLGEGATGKVKLGFHKDTGFKVAVKILKKEMLLSKPSLHKKVQREIAILKLIDHPYILKLFDVYETSKYLFIVMEYVEGGELFEYLLARGCLDAHEALRMFQMMIHAVDYIHSQHVCHRDLKPENILLDSERRLKLADLGMAAILRKGKLLSTSCGSPHYASPEVVTGREYDGRQADVWSCGVILYALVSGKLPFDDENIRLLLRKVKEGVFMMPPFLHKDIRDLISKMLVVDPTKRITISAIKQHPWFLSNRNALLSTPCTVLEDTADVIPQDSIDTDIVATLESLGMGSQRELEELFVSPAPSQARMFYRILAYQKEHPQSEVYERIVRSQAGRSRANTVSKGTEDAVEYGAPVKLTGTSRDRSNSVGPKTIGILLPRVGSPRSQPVSEDPTALKMPVAVRATTAISGGGGGEGLVLPYVYNTDCSPSAEASGSGSGMADVPRATTSPSAGRRRLTRPTPPGSALRRLSTDDDQQSGACTPIACGSPAKRTFWASFFKQNPAGATGADGSGIRDGPTPPLSMGISDLAVQSGKNLVDVQKELQRCFDALGVEWHPHELGFRAKYSTLEGLTTCHFTVVITRIKKADGSVTYFTEFKYDKGDVDLYNDMCSVIAKDAHL